jgi:hypothetical protein
VIEGHRTRITRWLRQVLSASEQPDRILIRHVTIEDRQTEISAIGLEGFVPSEEALLTLGEDIENTIHADATGLGGIQRYLVVACLGDALIARLPIRQVASEVRIGDPVDSEPATPQGLLAQLMRHNEAQARLFAGAMGQIVGNMGETIERQRVEIDKADSIRIEALQRVENLISHEHERDLDLLKETNRAKRLQQAVGFAMGVAPFIANRVLGKTVFKESSASPVKALLKQLYESLTEEQRSKLLGILSPVQLAALQQLFASATDAPPVEKTSNAAPEGAPSSDEDPPDGAQKNRTTAVAS